MGEIFEKIEKITAEIDAFQPKNEDALEDFRLAFLSKKGRVNALFSEFRGVPKEKKKKLGKELNILKQRAEQKFQDAKKDLESKKEEAGSGLDLSRPAGGVELGSRHPVSLVRREVLDIFKRIGFDVSYGPEIEDDWHNFTALNFPPEHPARDMQDTFFVGKEEDQMALRTHTSSVQVRLMESTKPPIRSLMPGRVFRNEAISSRSHCIFHQVEGLYIDKDVSFADLKQTIQYFAQEMFGKTKIRLRPSYFPFTEPSAEVDVYWGLESETDHKITKGTGWLEIMGCGMVDPEVLKNCDIDPDEYSGFAFGMGIERIALQRYQIPDIRMLFENDIRFLSQFKSGF